MQFFNLLKITWLMSLVLAMISSVAAKDLPDFTSLVKENKSAVVNISAIRQVARKANTLEEYFERFRPPNSRGRPPNQPPRRESLGSGFILSEDGYVLTNSHVVENASEVFVSLSDRRELVAEVVGTDSTSDIALLKVDAKGLPKVTIGRSKDIEVGEWVLAIGSPFGFDYSVTSGIVSALRRSLPTEENENYVPFIQTDVAINPGNSGGPLFNLDGEVIGVNSQIYTRTGSFIGVSFAIPIDIAMEVAEQIKTNGKVTRGWLGVIIQEVSLGLAESFGLDKPKGALVNRVLEDSPADKGGIREGDVVVGLNDQPIVLSGELPHVVGRIKPGTKVSVDVIRAGKQIQLDVTLGELGRNRIVAGRSFGNAGRKKAASGRLNKRLGLEANDLSLETSRELQSIGYEGGVRVRDLKWPGAAAKAGILVGDILVSVDGKPINSVVELDALISKLKGKKVPVHIVRQANTLLFVPLQIPASG